MRLIDADAIDTQYSDPEVIETLEEAPTIDAVPVVFCDKCKYWDRDWEPNHSDGNQHFCPMIGLVTDADFFCKDGERKGGDDA